MNADCYYEIGHSHTNCQDYALTGNVNDNLTYALISDGCSSSEDVDVGARILVHAAKEYLLTAYKEHFELPQIQASDLALPIIVTAARHVRDLMLSLVSLDCTLLIILSDGRKVNAFIYGDGGFLIKKKNGSSSIYHYVNFPSGAPYYLSYLLSPVRQERYFKEFGQDAIIKRECIENGVTITSSIDTRIDDFQKLYNMASFCEEWDFEWIAATSDGINSFQENNDDGSIVNVEKGKMVQAFSDYKNFKGKFVERRMRRISKDCQKESITHYDDISCATIYMGN